MCRCIRDCLGLPVGGTLFTSPETEALLGRDDQLATSRGQQSLGVRRNHGGKSWDCFEDRNRISGSPRSLSDAQVTRRETVWVQPCSVQADHP